MRSMHSLFVVAIVAMISVAGCGRASQPVNQSETRSIILLLQQAELSENLRTAFKSAVAKQSPYLTVVNDDFPISGIVYADSTMNAGFINLPVGTGVKYWEIEDSTHTYFGYDLSYQLVSIDNGQAIGFRIDASESFWDWVGVVFFTLVGFLVIVVIVVGAREIVRT